MCEMIKDLPRFVAGMAQGKRIHFAWQEARVCPSNLTNVFAFDENFRIGVLLSAVHHEWARAQSSTLEDRFRYTPTTAFETFPWPQPSDEHVEAIGESARAVLTRRGEVCVEREIGLTKLYNEVDDGAYRDLKGLHNELDEAVAVAYGWPKEVAHDHAETNRRLLELNRAVARAQVGYEP
jgi:hypothetical protein